MRVSLVLAAQTYIGGGNIEKVKEIIRSHTKTKEHPERWSGNARNWVHDSAVELNPEQNKVAA